MANTEQFVTDLRFNDPAKELGTITQLIEQVNKSFAHGSWDGRDKLKAEALIDELTGRDIREVRDTLNKERARLAGLIKAMDNTARFVDDYLKPAVPQSDLEVF